MAPFGHKYSHIGTDIVTWKRRFPVKQDRHSRFIFPLSWFVNRKSMMIPSAKKPERCLWSVPLNDISNEDFFINKMIMNRSTNVSSNPTHYEMYMIQHDVIKCVSDLRQVSGFLTVLWFSSIKLTATI